MGVNGPIGEGRVVRYLSPMRPEFRNATIADLPAVEAVIRAAFAIHTARIGKPPAPMLRSYRPDVEAGDVSVLEDARGVVGVLVRRAMRDHLYLDVVAIRPECQGEGLGRQLLARAEAEALAAGLAEVRLLTNALMTGNLTLYTRLGYVETHRAEEDGYHRVFMRKSVVQPEPDRSPT